MNYRFLDLSQIKSVYFEEVDTGYVAAVSRGTNSNIAAFFQVKGVYESDVLLGENQTFSAAPLPSARTDRAGG